MTGFRITYISKPKENNEKILDRVEGTIEFLDDDVNVKISVQLITKDKYENLKWYRDIFLAKGESIETYKEALKKLSYNLQDEFHKEKSQGESFIKSITIEKEDENSTTAELNIGVNLGDVINSLQERLARIEERLARLEQPFSWPNVPWPNTTPSIPTNPQYPWTTGDPVYPQYPSYPIITCENDQLANLRTMVQDGIDKNIQC